MNIAELDFEYPENLIGLQPQNPSRVMWVDLQKPNPEPEEITIPELLRRIPPGDALVINDTQVLRRRIFTEQFEILFLKAIDPFEWEVLFPAKDLKVGDSFLLPVVSQHNLQIQPAIKATLVQKGRPQRLRTEVPLTEEYFQQVAELPLPPYIQKMRSDRHNLKEDQSWYQTAWAKKPGSLAAPTASLHFSNDDLSELKNKGVKVCQLTLHVGLGTFLPVTTKNIEEHVMHAEWIEISADVLEELRWVRKNQGRIWALGTTATRSLESWAQGLLQKDSQSGVWSGESNLFIYPNYVYKMVDVLLTNFHQPKSTLLALVAAFADLKTVQRCYQWAIGRQFKLFSYGDLSVWFKNPSANSKSSQQPDESVFDKLNLK